ncbi:TPA: HD domain-containing protein [bacterium]|jgi:3'-5' exoribonuclease|nr:HD domain-containing protein [bacterium]
MIKDFKENTRIKEQLLVASSTTGVTTAGSRYLNILLQDVSKQIDARKWDATDEDVEIFKAGNVVEVEADVIKFRNDLQLKVLRGKVCNDDIDPTNFVTSAPVSKNELQAKFLAYVDNIKHPEIAAIIKEVINDVFISFFNYPAAVKNHHDYISGLAHHTVTMLDLASSICDIYPDLDREILYAGVILHDIGKIEELSGSVLPKYTVKGKLLGHISIMQAKVYEIANRLQINSEIPILLQHMILSHHGKYEYGSPVLPLTKEAEVLSMIDNLDAKLNTINKALSTIEEGETTHRLFSLDDRMFYKPTKNKK